MAIETIDVGSAPGDETGDLQRVAFQKSNSNFQELEETSAANLLGSAY